MSLRVCPPPILGRRPRAKSGLGARVQGLRHRRLLPTPPRPLERFRQKPKAGAAAGAAAGLAAGSGWRRTTGPGERGLEDDEDAAPGGNRTGQGVYSYRAWTSGAGSTGSLRLCLLLGGALVALGLLRP
ncbi:shadow of prion protein [Suricata suricatta]|uniref:shadow of prion protein n=1 Tax=Suricata suricatta TaxID=37032 RepID=UPI0011556E82|nr:shadow of prion protein [Suricata suricatta]